MSEAPVIGRRRFVGGAVALATIGAAAPLMAEDRKMFGLIGKLKAKPGQREALAAAISGGSEAMPGCLSYIVAEDLADADALWVTEVWESKAAHEASLSLPTVKEAIAKGRPLIAGFESGAETRPIAGIPGAGA